MRRDKGNIRSWKRETAARSAHNEQVSARHQGHVGDGGGTVFEDHQLARYIARALAHRGELGVPVVIARLFNIVGPRQSGRWGMVLPRFIAAARAGQPLRVFGDGRQTRCLCHVADAVDALLRLWRCPQADGEVVNIGDDEEISIMDLARIVIEELHSSSPIERIPYEAAYQPGFQDMPRRRPDLRKLERLTGSRPRSSTRELIRRIAAETSAVP